MNVDSMLGQNHDIYHEFPEFAERIEKMRTRDQDFARLCRRYTDLNREIIRIEQGVEPRDNYYFEDAKKKRLLQKDLIYQRLTAGR